VGEEFGNRKSDCEQDYQHRHQRVKQRTEKHIDPRQPQLIDEVILAHQDTNGDANGYGGKGTGKKAYPVSLIAVRNNFVVPISTNVENIADNGGRKNVNSN